MNDVNAFFNKGYKKNHLNQTQGYIKAIKGELPKSDIPKSDEPEIKSSWPEATPSDDSNVAVNVMGIIYEGKNRIEIVKGDVIVDGIREGQMPYTSGTWFKILKGTQLQKNVLTIIESCDTMKGVDK